MKLIFACDRMIRRFSDIPTPQNLIKGDGLLDILVENFISFPKSTRSSKTEFGAESNDQNTKHHGADFVSGWIIRPVYKKRRTNAPEYCSESMFFTPESFFSIG